MVDGAAFGVGADGGRPARSELGHGQRGVELGRLPIVGPAPGVNVGPDDDQLRAVDADGHRLAAVDGIQLLVG